MGRMGYPLINVAHRLILHQIQGIYQKNQHEQVGTLKRGAQLSLARRGQRQRWTGHRTCRRKSNLGNTSMNKKKRDMRKPTPGLWKKSQWGLTSVSTAMDLMIQVPCNGVVPRQRFGQIPQLFVGPTPEQGAQTVASYRQVPQDLQQVEQHSDRQGVQHQRLQRAHHLDHYN